MWVDDALPHGRSDVHAQEKCDKVEKRRPHHGPADVEDACADDGRDRIGGVVEPVDEVEAKRDEDDERYHAVDYSPSRTRGPDLNGDRYPGTPTMRRVRGTRLRARDVGLASLRRARRWGASRPAETVGPEAWLPEVATIRIGVICSRRRRMRALKSNVRSHIITPCRERSSRSRSNLSSTGSRACRLRGRSIPTAAARTGARFATRGGRTGSSTRTVSISGPQKSSPRSMRPRCCAGSLPAPRGAVRLWRSARRPTHIRLSRAATA